jgi:hypothetical protein
MKEIWQQELNEFTPRCWDADTQSTLGGWMALAGIDVQNAFSSHDVEHPMVGQRFSTPEGDGIITKCLTHPRGYLMFDVEFDKPTPWVHVVLKSAYGPGFYDVLSCVKVERYARFPGKELHFLCVLKAIQDGKDVPKVNREQWKDMKKRERV